MNEPLTYSCICGAAGDLGELEEHCLEKFKSVEDRQDHDIIGADVSDEVAAARERWQTRLALQTKIAELFDAPIEDVRDALMN